MAVCGSCGADNPAGFKYCGSCGTQLGGPGCPACGFANPPGQHFCGQCGTRLDDAATTPAAATSSPGERKLATILFADVVGFTSLSENSDPEAVARTVDAAGSGRQTGAIKGTEAHSAVESSHARGLDSGSE